ncbi:MAG: hypothetical protein LBI14_00320 [Treponema sp.]|jgi:hypothetical protein|nr:hypothetical protein [Treponema sp.]
MNQSAILRASYEAIYNDLSKLGKENKLFLMGDGDSSKTGTEASVYLGISDLSQICADKNGQKIVEDEMTFEAPTQVGCIFFLTVSAKTYPPILEAVGSLIQYFKDNNAIVLEDHKWHGEDKGKIFIEPVIREPELQKEIKIHEIPAIILKYRMEMGINSQKGTPFKRIEKRTIKGNIIDQ